MPSNWLLLFIPVAIILDWVGANPILVFLASALAIVPLARLMGDATEALGESLGPTLGGLLNASLGNAPEIIIAVFALYRGLIDVVKASITGSIVGNLLFGLGASMFAGGLTVRYQTFDSRVAQMNGALLTLASFGLIVPAIYRIGPLTGPHTGREISLEISVILFLIYLASLMFTLVTHKPVVGKPGVEAEKEETGAAGPEPEQHEHEGPDRAGATVAEEKGRSGLAGVDAEAKVGWSRNKALGILAAVAIGLAIMSEILTGAIEPAATSIGLTPLFAGVFVLAPVGNGAELLNAVRFARKDKMDLSIGITVGASIQVALLVAPVLVFAGSFLDQEMNLLFSPYEMWAVIMAVFITRTLINDGESSWLEGLMLIGIYFMLGFGFFHLPA
jgi:Ca2+:H+ antiporter